MVVAAATSAEVAGRTVRLPVGVRDAYSASAAFAVPAAALQAWLPTGLVPVPVWPGRGLLNLSMIRYLDGDLGCYDELSIAAVVRHGSRTGTYIHRLPVDDEFSRAAGRSIWGFPKTVEALTVEREPTRFVCRWYGGQQRVLHVGIAAAGRGVLPASAYRAYTLLDGRLHTTRFVMRATGLGVRRGGADVDLGAGPVADELRSLGLPKRALFSMSMDRMQARFDAPRQV